jgi:hypothetical protein
MLLKRPAACGRRHLSTAMDESQKAWELRSLIDAKFKRYAQTIAEQLDREAFTEGVDSEIEIT